MNAWAWFWIGWALVGLTVEIVTLRRKQSGDTLSEQFWALDKWLDRWPIVRPFFHIITIGGLGWLILHFTLHLG